MPNAPIAPAYYIFCDEFGDPSLKGRGSEWFIVSATVVAAPREPQLPSWIAKIKEPMNSRDKPELHFRRLPDHMKLRAARFLSKLPVRCFVLASHKANMIGHRNKRVEERYSWREYSDDGESYVARPRNTYFHNFTLKLLLERATAWCAQRGTRDYGSPQPVEIVIAQRGGFYIGDFKATLEIDRMRFNSRTGTLPGYLTWSVVDLARVRTAPASDYAGLQLADIVAGAFSHAVDESRFGAVNTKFAEALRPRMAKDRYGRASHFGVTGLPWKLWKAGLSPAQQAIFKFYGYRDEMLVRPGPIPTRK